MTDKEVETLLAAARPLIDLAITEDIGPGDATSIATLDPELEVCGRVVAKAAGVVAGLPVAEAVFLSVDPAVRFEARVIDGQEVVPGEPVALVTGRAVSLLAAERTALNFLQRLSGIATLTRQYVDAVATTGATILDTRKTVPGYRVLDKYAVRMGGGQNHRLSLFDMALIKDNHIDATGGIREAVGRVRDRYPDLPVEVEVRDLDELRQALAIEPPLDRILLDNMDLETMRAAVRLAAGRVPLEASGGVRLDGVAEIAATGVDLISAGALTHSAPALDISMKVSHLQEPEPSEAQRARVRRARARLGDRLVILGHHYQRDEVIEFADLRGDSLKLAQDAAQTEAEFVVFCGVHFMAEVAAILVHPGQHVLTPDITAGCYLADTATLSAVEAAWHALEAVTGKTKATYTPVTYVNSSAELKAFCGAHGGTVCTSGNASQVLRWALERRPKVFFFPDQHLGRNTAKQMGFAPEQMLLWDIRRPPSAGEIRKAEIILWPGACNVHQRFRPADVWRVRDEYPGIRVIVHPECPAAVVDLADDVGSTAYIIRRIDGAGPGARWAVGTENHLVHRLQSQHADQLIIPLAAVPPFCATMGQITLANLADLLDGLTQGKLVNEVTVEADTAHWARIALERMLSLA
jgi:quinolinate synthase